MTENQAEKNINIDGGVQAVAGENRGTVHQYIITQQSEAQIRGQPLIPGSPYVGLRKFQSKDKDKFFGRDGQILSFSDYLEQNKLLLLMGVSGSGKSSLVLAGLIPHFEDKWGTSQFSHLTFVPSQDPFKSLDKKISDKYSNIVDCLASEPSEDILIQLVNSIKQDYERQLIFIDQFEELFTLTSKDKQELFIKCLLRLIQHQDSSIHVVMTMRSDFLGSLSPHPELTTALEKHIRIIKDMTRDELRLAIAEPAARNHVTFEGNLVEKIIDDFLGQAGSLPLLQYTLDLLWEKDKELDGLTDQILNISTYEVVGGVAGALQKQANRIYTQLTEAEQKIVQQIFIDLVDIVDEKRISKPVELARFQDGGVQEKVVNTLVDNRLLVRGTEESETKPMVQVAHEKLLRSWGILDTLFKEKEEIILLRRRLVTDANHWQALRQNDPQKATDELWGGSKLERVLELLQVKAIAGLNETVEQFIKASVAWRDRTQREQQKQIEELERALTESQLREKAARVINIASFRSQEALELAITATGDNLDKIPEKFLATVQVSLNKVITDARVSITIGRHEDPVNSVAFSPDGKMIVSGSRDETLRLWDLEGNPIGQPFQGHKDPVNSVAFSPDGKMIVSGSRDKTLRLWDLKGNSIGQPFQGHENAVCSVAFSPDGKMIVSGSHDKTLRLWDLEGNPIGQLFQGHEDSVFSVAFSPDGKMIVSGSWDKTVRLWDLEGNPIRQPFQGHEGFVCSVAFSPDGKMIVSGSNDGTLRLWDLEGNSIGQSFQGHEYSVDSVAFSPDGKIIVSGSVDNTLRLWDLKGNPIGQPFQGHEYDVDSVAFSPDGKMIVSGSVDNTLRLWDLEGNQIGQPFQGHEHDIWSVAFSPDGKMIVSGSWDNKVRLWDLEGNPIGQPFQGHEDSVFSVAFSPNGKMIVSGSSDRTLRLWDLEGNPIGQPFQGHEDSVFSVAFSPNGKMIVSGSGDRTLRLWGGKPTQPPFQGHGGIVWSVAFSPDGRYIVSGSDDETVRLWDLEGNQIGQPFQGHKGSVITVAFSPNSQLIGSGSRDKAIGLWDLQGNLSGQFFQGHEDYVYSVAFSPDGTRIVSGSRDKTIRLWNLEGNPIGQPFQGHEDAVLSVAFSPDGKMIVSGSRDRTVRLWRGHWMEWLKVCCNRLKHHPAFKNPQTEDEKRAYDIANRYVYNPQIGADELYRKAKQKITAKDYTAAVDILTLAIQLNPDHIQAYRDRTHLFGHLQQYYRAIKDCDHILKTHPDDADITYTRGRCYAKLDKLEQAQTDYQQAITLYEQQGKAENAQKIRNLLLI